MWSAVPPKHHQEAEAEAEVAAVAAVQQLRPAGNQKYAHQNLRLHPLYSPGASAAQEHESPSAAMNPTMKSSLARPRRWRQLSCRARDTSLARNADGKSSTRISTLRPRSWSSAPKRLTAQRRVSQPQPQPRLQQAFRLVVYPHLLQTVAHPPLLATMLVQQEHHRSVA